MARLKTIAIAAAILFMVFGGYIFAQGQQSYPPRGGAPEIDPGMEHMIDMMFRDMDTNHDGKISKSEWLAFYEKRFNQIDKNSKGFITKDDVRADMRREMDQMRKRGAPPPQ